MAYVTPVLTGSFQFTLHCEEMSLPNTPSCAKGLVIAVESLSSLFIHSSECCLKPKDCTAIQPSCLLPFYFCKINTSFLEV